MGVQWGYSWVQWGYSRGTLKIIPLSEKKTNKNVRTIKIAIWTLSRCLTNMSKTQCHTLEQSLGNITRYKCKWTLWLFKACDIVCQYSANTSTGTNYNSDGQTEEQQTKHDRRVIQQGQKSSYKTPTADMLPQPYPNFRLRHKFSMMVVGPSMSGKLLRQRAGGKGPYRIWGSQERPKNTPVLWTVSRYV